MALMKKLDWYLFKRYIFTFLFIVLMFSMISVVVDISQKLDDYTSPEGPSTSTIIDYYLVFIPFINSLLTPLYALIAVIFFTSRLAARSEIISIIGSGISYQRMLRPYLLAGGLIALFHLAGNHYLFPIANKSRVNFENTYIWKRNYKGTSNNIHMFLDDSTEIYIQNYSVEKKLGSRFSLMRYEGNLRPAMLSATQIRFKEAPNTWTLEDYKIRIFDGLEEELKRFPNAKKDTILDFKPNDLVVRDNLKETMTTPELDEYIEARRKRGMGDLSTYIVEKHRRSADAFTILILTIIGVSVASRKTRGGTGFNIAVGLITGALFVFMGRFSLTFSTHGGFSPILGPWIPNILFLFVAFYFYQKAQK